MTDGPGFRPDQILRPLALRRRVAYVAVGLGGLAGATMVALLWATEPGGLPIRTQIGFAALIVIGMTWAIFAGVALIRRPLFAIDRVVAAWLALVFSALLAAGMVVIALSRDSTVGLATAAALGLPLIAVAGALVIRSHTYRSALLTLRRELEESS